MGKILMPLISRKFTIQDDDSWVVHDGREDFHSPSSKSI